MILIDITPKDEVVQPDGVPADRLTPVAEQTPKGFEPVDEPGAYLVQIVRHLGDSVGVRTPGIAHR